MLKKLTYFLPGMIFCIMTFSFLEPPPRKPASKPGIKTIIIDAGHGGRDRGAHGDRSYEKDICLGIALKLGKKMHETFPDLKILYTRTRDNYPAIKSRADFANTRKGDLFISIHVNAAPRLRHKKYLPGYKTEVYYTGKGRKRKKRTRRVRKYVYYYSDNPIHGTETYIWAADRTDEKGDFVSERIAEDGRDEYIPDIHNPAFKAKSLLWTKRFFDKSLLLANLVQKEVTRSGRTSRGVRQRNEKGIWVLQATAMPSILVEAGYISHRSEEDFLNSKKGQDVIASEIVRAVKNYRAMAR